VTSKGEAPQDGEMTDTQLEQLLGTASDELLDLIRATDTPPMPGQEQVALVREVDGHLVFGAAVARIAETLSPVGAAARAVAEVAAAGVELRRLALEGKQIEADKIEALLRLEYRHVKAGKSIHPTLWIVTLTEVDAEQLRDVITAVQEAIFPPGVSLAEKEVYQDVLYAYSTRLVESDVASGNALADQLEKILSGDWTLGPNQLRRSSPGR
jgi:hypothetical protein